MFKCFYDWKVKPPAVNTAAIVVVTSTSLIEVGSPPVIVTAVAPFKSV
jgi:hypothetical protein